MCYGIVFLIFIWLVVVCKVDYCWEGIVSRIVVFCFEYGYFLNGSIKSVYIYNFDFGFLCKVWVEVGVKMGK